MQKSKAKNKRSLPSNGKTVLVGGCFDILHYGHLVFLKKAKALGNRLVVLLESDENTRKLKGAGRPFHNQKQRAEILKSLSFVDEVVELKKYPKNNDYAKILAKIAPDIIAVTEGDKNIKIKSERAKEVGAKVVEIPMVKSFSTTKIARKLGFE